MKKFIVPMALLFSFNHLSAQVNTSAMRIIMIGAHPDDCDGDGGGTAILLASMGYAVKFVSVTNGDAGHQSMGGGALAKRRMAEATSRNDHHHNASLLANMVVLGDSYFRCWIDCWTCFVVAHKSG